MSRIQVRTWILTAAMMVAPAVHAGDVVTDWDQKAEAAVLEAKLYPFVAGRTMSLVHVAMFDAINSIEGRYSPYKVKVSAPAETSPEAAGVAAAHAVLVKLFPEQKAALDAAYAASIAQIPDGSGKTAGIGVGEDVAGKILALRAADGSDAPNTCHRSRSVCADDASDRIAMGQRDAVGDGARVAVSSVRSSGFEERGMGARLQRDERSGRKEEHDADSRANRDCALLDNYGPAELGLHRAATGWRFREKFDPECTILRAGRDGRSGCVYCGVRRQVRVQFLAADYSDSQWGLGWQ